MIGGGFFGGYEGEVSIQNVENNGLEIPAKTTSLYLVQKPRNFWGTIDVGSIKNEENKLV